MDLMIVSDKLIDCQIKCSVTRSKAMRVQKKVIGTVTDAKPIITIQKTDRSSSFDSL